MMSPRVRHRGAAKLGVGVAVVVVIGWLTLLAGGLGGDIAHSPGTHPLRTQQSSLNTAEDSGTRLVAAKQAQGSRLILLRQLEVVQAHRLSGHGILAEEDHGLLAEGGYGLLEEEGHGLLEEEGHGLIEAEDHELLDEGGAGEGEGDPASQSSGQQHPADTTPESPRLRNHGSPLETTQDEMVDLQSSKHTASEPKTPDPPHRDKSTDSISVFPRTDTSSFTRQLAANSGIHDIKPGRTNPENVTTTTSGAGTGRLKPLPCDEECRQFGQLLDSPQWPADKPRAAFYYLTQSSRLEYLRQSLASVDRYFNDEFHYPIVIFHEEEFTRHRDAVRAMTSSRVFFQTVVFRLPDFITRPVVKNIPCLSEVSYRHMCRFHAREVYLQPITAGLEYHWRLDDDSLLLSPVPYDVFAYLKVRRLKYGYVWIFLDAMSCTEGLWEATEEFIRSHNVTTTFFKDWRRPKLFYNNFEISSLDIWRSPQYQAYVDYLDGLGGIFYHRWGDAPIKGLGVSMFVERRETHFFRDVEYQHRSFVNNASEPTPLPQYLYPPDKPS